MCKIYEKDNISRKNISRSFANGLNFYKLFWIFYIGCFSGVVIETVWCLLKNGEFESRRAFLLSPLNPVYGFAALFMSMFFVKKYTKNIFYIFLGCSIIGGIFEYLCSLIQDIIFGSVSWVYHSDSLDIFGRTSLIYCFFWGILGIIWVKFIYPLISKAIETIPNKIGITLTYFIAFAIICDATFSSLALLRQQERRHGISANNNIEKYYDENYNDSILKKIYPNMMFTK